MKRGNESHSAIHCVHCFALLGAASLMLPAVASGQLQHSSGGHSSASDRAAEAALQELGASIERDGRGRVLNVSIVNGQFGDKDVVHLRNLSWSLVPSTAPRPSGGYRNYPGLGLWNVQITDVGVKQILSPTPFVQFNFMALTGNKKITNKSLAYLQGLTDLKGLFLNGTNITDDGLMNLKEMSRLERLGLANTNVTDSGLEYLAGLPLRMLDLTGTRITNDGLAHLAGMADLENLALGDTEVTTSGVRHLRGLANLSISWGWDTPPDRWQWNVPDERPYVEHRSLESASMQKTIGFNVFLPPGYSDKTKRFPVVYFLHGAFGSEASHTELAGFVKEQIESGNIDDAIYVFPNGGLLSAYRDWKDENVKSETWIVNELIPHIDQTYRTIASREGRAVSGFSMGGDGALYLAVKHPDKFCGVAALAGPFNWKEGMPTIQNWATRNTESVRDQVRILIVCGEEDRQFRRQGPVTAHLDSLKIPYTFYSIPGVGHSLNDILRAKGVEIVQELSNHYAEARSP